MYFSGNPPRKKTHGLLRKILGTYFEIQAIFFKIYGLYFCIFQTSETQQLTKAPQQPVYFPFFAGTDTPFSALVFSKTELRTALHFARTGITIPRSFQARVFLRARQQRLHVPEPRQLHRHR